MPDRLGSSLRRWPRAVVAALLPCACALCGGRAAEVVCAPCRVQFLVPLGARCRRCANPLDAFGAGVATVDAGAEPGACLAHRPAFDATLAAAPYAAPLDQLLLQLKFGSRLALAPWFALALRDAVLAEPDFALPDLLCPVPLGPRRLVERGFNQALEIARPLAAALGIALHPQLALRVRDTPAQSGAPAGARQANVRRAFCLAPASLALVRGRHVGVVDDVMTSGQTLGELAATLKRHGAARVSNLVFARTAPH